MSVISPKNLTDHPIFENHMDPLSDLFGSMSIQEVTYKRLEVKAPWGFRVPGSNGSADPLRLTASRIGAFEIQESVPNHLSSPAGDVYIFIFNDEPIHWWTICVPRSSITATVVETRSGWRDSIRWHRIAHDFCGWVIYHEHVWVPANFYDFASVFAPAFRTKSRCLSIGAGSFGGRNRSSRF